MAAYPEHGDERAKLLKCADQALYQAKQSGRDQVVVASTEPVEHRAPCAVASKLGDYGVATFRLTEDELREDLRHA